MDCVVANLNFLKIVYISLECVICVSSSSQLNKPVTIQLEYCANITNNKQAQHLNFVVPKCGPPFKFEYIPGGSFSSCFTICHYICI